MSRLRAALFVLLALIATPVLPDERPLAKAMADMRSGNWASALIESRGDGQAALDVILWHYLRSSYGDA